MFGEVPMLPVVVPLAAIAFVALLWHLRRRGELSAPRALVALTLCGYGAGVVANTIFPIYLDKPGGTPPWTRSVNLVPIVGYELADAVQNVVVLIPLGVLLPLIWARTSTRRVAWSGFLLSIGIESAQLFSDHFVDGGHIADINDVFFNVLGAPLGYGLFRLVTQRAPGRTLVDRLRWPAPS